MSALNPLIVYVAIAIAVGVYWFSFQKIKYKLAQSGKWHPDLVGHFILAVGVLFFCFTLPILFLGACIDSVRIIFRGDK
jgi:hypothetical protein